MTHSHVCLLVAVILFGVVAVIRGMARSIDGTLIAVGLAFFAVAFLIT